MRGGGQHSPPMTDANLAFGSVYQAASGFEAELAKELGEQAVSLGGGLWGVPSPPVLAAWAQNIWLKPESIAVQSIGHAVKELKARGRNWAPPVAFHLHRRQGLIHEQLPKVSMKPLAFPQPAPSSPLGAFTLLDERTLLASPITSTPFADGAVKFVEDRENPPNRAYLKLWEALTRLRRYPTAGETCLDLGACPGGWTWVLAGFGANVTAIDKAPLDAKIAVLPNVAFRQESAFSLDPHSFGAVDWLCSDVICYPDRLYEMVASWLETGLVGNFVITVKLQGETDFSAIDRFKSIPGSRLIHLFHNKHELTWLWSRETLPDYL